MTNDEPILAGFYPDPSICRVGELFYLVTSSFEYLPGLPVHASEDLITWTLVGNALTRPSQMAENLGYPSSGNFAPTIRHHDGRLWIIGTNVNDIPSGRGHFLISTQDAAGPWSDPVFISGAIGIDPDLAWDDEGTAHVTWCSLDPSQPGIRSAPVDVETGAMLAPSRSLWAGTGLAAPEGPHLYRRDGWWYLLLAEGGTERGHTATVARARTLDGPFEPAPHNPILSHRSLAHPVQNTGHADLVELPDGGWAAVHLGVRPRGQSPSFHVNGRESFLVGIDWVDGWPVVDEDRYTVPARDREFRDTFETERLHPRWIGVGRYPESFTRPAAGGGLIVARAKGDGRALLAARATDPEWSASVRLSGSGVAKFAVRIDQRHEYALVSDGHRVEAVATVGSIQQSLGHVDTADGVARVLTIRAKGAPLLPHGVSLEPDLVELSATIGGHEYPLAELDGRYLSTEVAGGFTGRVFGVEAVDGEVCLEEIEYRPVRTPSPAPSPSFPS